MLCPRCNSKSHILDTRQRNNRVYRRQICKNCGLKFTTYETYSREYKPMAMIKRRGTNETINRT